ncbi:MAG: hypothetical protein PCFJNLEI_02637 [Verrucomicrobiae bacterium]|nr:hypothetical protein [Verrucomicrobiae bacterium]
MKKMRRSWRELWLPHLCWSVILGVGWLTAPLGQAATGTWTNYLAGGTLTGYWTNNASWSPTVTGHPGTNANEDAFLTNNVALAYTNIVNARINNSIRTLAVSNTLGEAWLIITNTALTNATSVTLNHGGRLQVDNGGTLRASSAFAWAGTNGAIYLNNGGLLFTAGALTMSGGTTGLVSSASGAGNGGVWNRNAQALNIGSSTDDNILRITGGAVVTNSGALNLSGNRNSLLVTDGGQLVGSGAITFGASGNTFTLGSGFWTHSTAALTINGTSNALNLVGGTLSNATGLIVGGAAGANFNSLIVTNGGRLVSLGGGLLRIGATAGIGGAVAAGGSGNTVILSNSLLITATDTPYIGFGTSDNSMTVLEQTLWTGGNQFLIVGATAATNNLLTVSGAVLTNFSTLRLGANGNSISNRIVIRDEAKVFFNSFAVIGFSAGDNFNSLVVSNGGQLFVAGGISLGTGGNTGNTIRVTGGGQLSGSGVINFGPAENTLEMGGGHWTYNSANALTINGRSNALRIVGGVVSNVGGLTVGGAPGADYNTVVATNGGRLLLASTGGLKIGSSAAAPGSGGAGGSFNTVILSNSFLSGVAGHEHFLGWSSSENTLVLLDHTLWNGVNSLSVGRGTNNVLVVQGAIMTNFFTLSIGAGGNSFSNRALVTDNGQIFIRNGLTVGFNAGDTANRLTITNGGSVFAGSAITVGAANSTNNSIWIAAGGQLVSAAGVTVGAAGASGNSLFIVNGGLLQATGLTIGGGTGNTISNRNGTFQFTNALVAITSLNHGDIALTDGTIAFRNISTGLNLTNNWRGTALTNIAFAGHNTLRLDNSSVTNTLAGGYTFNTGLGATNYYRLEMVNGTTAVTGHGVTIGAAGALLISNTSASLTGVFTNHGLTRLVGATANLERGIVNSGILSLETATLTGTVTNNGTLRGDGLVVGDVTSFGTNSPGFSVGTLSITGNVAFGSSAVTWMELFAGGSNDVISVSGQLTFGGELVVTNATGFAFAAGQSFQLFEFGSQNGTFDTLNLPDLMSAYLEWDTTQLDTAALLMIAAIPEPSAVVLVLGGLVIWWALGRRRRT